MTNRSSRCDLYLQPVVAASLPGLPPKYHSGVDVIADYLRAIASFALSCLNTSSQASGGLQLPALDNFNHIKWCITVPATWSQLARVAMREAAEMAGTC